MQQIKPVILLDIDDTLFNTALFIQSGLSNHEVYDEVMRVLKKLSTFAILGIFSEGETDFQKTKLEKTEILKYFKEDDIHIYGDKNTNFLQAIDNYKDNKVFLVDDRLDVLNSAKRKMKKIITIWIKRGRYAENQKPISGFKPDAKVENLSEIVRIVKSNL